MVVTLMEPWLKCVETTTIKSSRGPSLTSSASSPFALVPAELAYFDLLFSGSKELSIYHT